MSFCVPAFLTRQRFSDPLIHPSAPRRGVERRLRERVMRPRIMQQAVRHKASSHKPPSPLFPTSLEHPESGMQNVVLLLVDLRACCVHTSPPLRPTAPPKRSSPRGRKASASARHAATHHADGRQAQGFLTHTSITPLPYHPPASQLWHAKCSAIACRFACLLSQVTTAKAHCSTQALLAQMQKGFCVSASCCDASCRRPSGTGLPRAHLHHPSALPGSGIQRLACKM